MATELKIQEKIDYLTEILGINVLEDFSSKISKYKFSTLDQLEINEIKDKYIKIFIAAIDNPSTYTISSYQRDNRSKIQVIKDILIGQFFEDCFLLIFNKYTNKKCYLNYERFKIGKYLSDEDFVISGKKTYFVEFKTLSFKNYTELPIKESNVKGHEDSYIFLMNKDNNDIYVLECKEIMKKPLEDYKKWNKKCFMLNKKELTTKFNLNEIEEIKKIGQIFE